MIPKEGAYVPIRFYLDAVGATGALVLKFYGDCAGKNPDHVFRVAAGYLGTVDQWSAFESRWQPILDDAGVDYFHATDFFNVREEFEGWELNSPRHTEFAKRFCAAVTPELLPVAHGLELEPFHRLVAPLMEGMPDSPHRRYTPTMHCYMNLVRKLRFADPTSNESVAVFLEQEDGLGEFIDYFILHKERGTIWTRQIATIVPVGKKCLPVQAADLLSHEAWRLAKEQRTPTGRPLRKSFLSLVEDSAAFMLWDTEEKMREDLPSIREYTQTWRP